MFKIISLLKLIPNIIALVMFLSMLYSQKQMCFTLIDLNQTSPLQPVKQFHFPVSGCDNIFVDQAAPHALKLRRKWYQFIFDYCILFVYQSNDQIVREFTTVFITVVFGIPIVFIIPNIPIFIPIIFTIWILA